MTRTHKLYSGTRLVSNAPCPGGASSRITPSGGRVMTGSLDVGSIVVRVEERVDRGAAGGVADRQPHRHRVRAGQAGDADDADLEREPVAAQGDDDPPHQLAAIKRLEDDVDEIPTGDVETI